MATDVQQLMARISGHHFIGGDYRRGSGSRHDIFDPATDQIVGAFADATPTEVDDAVAAANAAQKVWWSMSALDRATALHEVASRLLERSAITGECLTREMGKPYRESNWEGGASASAFRYYAEISRHDQGRIAGPAIAGQMHMTLKEPLGTIVSIVPFNFPVLLFGWQAAGALAAGNEIGRAHV